MRSSPYGLIPGGIATCCLLLIYSAPAGDPPEPPEPCTHASAIQTCIRTNQPITAPGDPTLAGFTQLQDSEYFVPWMLFPGIYFTGGEQYQFSFCPGAACTEQSHLAESNDHDWCTHQQPPGWLGDPLVCQWELSGGHIRNSLGVNVGTTLYHSGGVGAHIFPWRDSPGTMTLTQRVWNPPEQGKESDDPCLVDEGPVEVDCTIHMVNIDLPSHDPADGATPRLTPAFQNITLGVQPAGWATKYTWDPEGLSTQMPPGVPYMPIKTTVPTLAWEEDLQQRVEEINDARAAHSLPPIEWTHGSIAVTAARPSRVEDWGGDGIDPASWAVQDTLGITAVELRIENLVDPAQIPQYIENPEELPGVSGPEGPLFWYLGAPATVQTNLYPSSLNTPANRAAIELDPPGTMQDDPQTPGTFEVVQFWSTSPGDIVAEATFQGITVYAQRTVDARDFFYAPSEGWDQPGLPGNLVAIGAYASDLITSDSWNSTLVAVDPASQWLTNVVQSNEWWMIDHANLLGRHRDLYNTRWEWDSSAGMRRIHHAWDAPPYALYWQACQEFDWRGYGHPSLGYFHFPDLREYTQGMGGFNCHGAVLRSYGLSLLEGRSEADIPATLPGGILTTIAGLSTYAFSGGEAVGFYGHTVRVTGGGTGTGVTVYSVHNGTPNGNRGGFSSPTLGAVISAHPQWSPNTAVTVYPNPN